MDSIDDFLAGVLFYKKKNEGGGGMLSELLEIQPGVTAVIGSGGKTTLLRVLGQELAAQGRTVLLTTTTHILPFGGLENLVNPTETEIAQALKQHRLVCMGTPEEQTGKLTSPALSMAQLAALADVVLVEADGSHHLPLKAHASHEPVIPKETNQTICVVGLSGLGRPIAEAVHRPEVFARLTGLPPSSPATIEVVACALNGEHLAQRYFLNQADTPETWGWAKELAENLKAPTVAGALQGEVYFSCSF